MKNNLKMLFPFLHSKEKGQSFIILAFTFVGFIALLGLAIDLGMVYIERTALKRAIDAAVLSGVTELGNEEEAGIRAMEYLNLNGYDLTDSNIYFRGCISDSDNYYNSDGSFCGTAGCGNDNDPNQIINAQDFYPYSLMQPNDADVTNVFEIDTYRFQSTGDCGDADGNPATPPLVGDANKLVVTGTVKVDMSFMSLLGFAFVPVKDHSIAQNLDSIDAVVVLDRSGSMEFDPVCYGCWTRRDELAPSDPNYLTAAATKNDHPPYSRYTTYPANGVINRLGLTEGFTNTNRIRACTTDTYDADQDLPVPANLYTFNVDDTTYDQGLYSYIIMEAELYSLNPAPVDPELQQQGKGYWALQRGEGNYDSSATPYLPSQGTSIDSLPAHMAHHPSTTEYDGTVYGHHYTLVEAQSGNAPYLEYDFKFYPGAGWAIGNFYIWVRVHAGHGLKSSGNTYGDTVSQNAAYYAVIARPQSDPFPQLYVPPAGAVKNLANVSGTDWRWIRIDPGMLVDTTQNYRFYFYAGSAGYSIDRIVVSNNPSSSGNNGNGSALNNARTAPVTAASAQRAACDICNAVYGENISDPTTQCNFFQFPPEPKDNTVDPIFNEWEAPMRTTKEAIKFFVTRLDATRDQIGYVTYNSSSVSKTELACKRAAQTQGIFCITGGNPISYTTILKNVEDTRASSGTPTARGMYAGLQVLGINSANNNCDGSNGSSCSRGGGAQKVLILMTDGMPNTNGWENGCTSTSLDTSQTPMWDATDAPHSCPLYWADEAARNGVTVYTIGLGFGINRDYLKEIARLGNGQAYFSASGGDLNIIFSQILSNIYVRLIE